MFWFSSSQFYGSTAKSGPSSADPLSNPTRKHCIEQLEKILEAIFTAAQTTSEAGTESSTTTVPPSKAREYAEAVEKELFQHNCEPDPKNPHNLTHSKKYTAKFRTLHFNLKSNDYFRSRVASGALDAAKIYAMDQEDLLSPEVRAEQEAERARLLAQSVKVAAVQPKTKITHKGEEILDEFDSAGAAAGSTGAKGASERDTRMGGVERRDSMSASVMGDTPHIPNDGGFEAFSERSMSIQAGSPRMEHGSPRFGSPTSTSIPVFTDSPTGRAFSPVEDALRDQMTASPDKIVSENVREETEEFARPAMPHHSRSDSQSKSKLDLDAVWSTLQPAAPSASPEKEAAKESSEPPKEKEEDDMEMDSDEDSSASGDKKAGSEDKQVAEEYDPFSTEGRKKSDADDEFDALMGGEEAPRDRKAQEQKSADAVPTAAKPSDKSLDEIANLPSVWEGQIAVPDEGSFSARLVQVGGTPFGPHPSIWDRILPKGKIEITGRIDEKAASEYVVQSNFSHSRENVVLAILPANPSNNPAEYEKAEAAYSKLVKFYAERKRYGVAPPTAELKKVAKDHYIVPLKQDRALPDYVEILDSHILPDKGSRKRDYLLSVLVLQKGLGLNTTHRTSTNLGGSTPQSSQGQTQAGAPAVASQYGHLQPPQASISSKLSPSGQYGTTPQVPFSSNMSPPYQPPGVQTQVQGSQGAAPALDPAALQSLLSNPSLLQALSTTGSQQGSPIPPAAPTYGAFSPPPPSSMGIGGIGTYTAQPGAPAWGAPPQQQPPIQQYGAFPPPPPAQWNPAGSPPWQGQAGPPPPQAWGAPTNHPPGYIDPERIKAASAEARRIAEQDRMEKARRANEGGGGPYSRGSGNANGNNSRSGGRSRGNGNGHGRKGDSGMNQMQAGIQDRGWGRRG